MCIVSITTVDGKVIKEPFGEEDRCSNCGKTHSQAKTVITGSLEEEWGCSDECVDEMEEKGCCFEELGQYVYRQQKY